MENYIIIEENLLVVRVVEVEDSEWSVYEWTERCGLPSHKENSDGRLIRRATGLVSFVYYVCILTAFFLFLLDLPSAEEKGVSLRHNCYIILSLFLSSYPEGSDNGDCNHHLVKSEHYASHWIEKGHRSNELACGFGSCGVTNGVIPPDSRPWYCSKCEGYFLHESCWKQRSKLSD